MPVVEPVVTREKLGELLKEQSESESLDYKTTCDLNDTRHLVEITKDIGAMSINGGFIVIGADNHGNTTDKFSEENARLFDESNLRAKLRKYIPEPFDVRTGIHQLDGKWLVVLYVAPHPHGLCIFKADGSYSESSGKTKSAFYTGQIFARHGSSSEPWRQEDIERVLSNLITREKEKWRIELRRELAEMSSTAASAQNLARSPAAMLTWKIDADTFIATIVEQLRSNDTIPLRLLLDHVTENAREALARPDMDEVATLLDRLVCLAAIFITLEEGDWFDRVVKQLTSIYRLGFDEHGNPLSRPFRGHVLWVMVIERIFAIGAFAVRRRDWRSVKTLAVQPPHSQERVDYPSWVRHALVMGYRQDAFTQTEGDRRSSVSPLNLARNQIRKEKCLRPDFSPDDDGILDSLCQFDLLGALSVIATTSDMGSHIWYPCFSHYNSRRIEPAVRHILSDKEMRQTIFPLTDNELAKALNWLDDVSRKEGWNYFGWDRFRDPVITEFLSKHTPKA